MRTIEVVPDSVNGEIVLVMRLSAVVLVAAALTTAAIRGGASASAAPAVLDFQVLARDLPASEQRTAAALREGLVEAERIRAETKAWPGVDVLAAQGIPPFAPDPLDQAHYAWRRADDGVYHDYIGVPSSAGAPVFLVHLQEADPGTVITSKPAVDEVHHELTDGTPIHASVWKKNGATSVDDRAVTNPIAAGFVQVLIAPLPNL